jgi:glucosamine--fructose-6-phosphate aminotransferase (isomerizing)
MCGIVGAVSARNIVPVLVRACSGWNTAATTPAAWRCTRAAAAPHPQHQPGGRAGSAGRAGRHRRPGTGIAHTRWATHGAPAVHNAHPHFFGPGERRRARPGRIALVHNGIIENHDELRAELQAKGYVFTSQTDTEVIAHLVRLSSTTVTCSTPCSAPPPA